MSSWRCTRCVRSFTDFLTAPVILRDSAFNANTLCKPVTICVDCAQAKMRRTGFCEACGGMAHRAESPACRVCNTAYAEEQPSEDEQLSSSPIAAFLEW